MKKITSNLTVVFVVLLLAVTTVNSQDQSDAGVSRIYYVDNSGTLKEYFVRETTARPGLMRDVGVGWGDFQQVFSGGGGIIYAITQDGKLLWYKHNGYLTGASLETPGAWEGPKEAGTGWNGFEQVFSAGSGIIYAITQDGKLRWYKHNGYLTGLGTPGAWEGPKEVGTGWNGFRQVLPAGAGVILVVENNGKLRWYRHNGYLTGLGTPGAWEGPKEVGHGWAEFKTVFSEGSGVIYAITQDGKLLRYKHNGYLTGTGLDTPGSWDARKEAGRGFNDFSHVFALLTDANESRPTRSPSPTGNVGEDSFDKLKRRPPLQPENTIKVSVRYKKEFGYLTDSNAFGNVGPTSCSAFSVNVTVGDGSAQQTNPTRISSDSKMTESEGYYFCTYLVSDIPLNQPIKTVVRLSGLDQSAAWKNGSQSQPPPGQQRTIIIVSGTGLPLTLTAAQPRARQLFEMVYTTSPR